MTYSRCFNAKSFSIGGRYVVQTARKLHSRVFNIMYKFATNNRNR